MRSEAKKAFQHGFDLTEQELRRIFGCLMQQMERVCQDAPPKASFEVKFKNGVITNPASLEEIFALENIGSGAILRLLIKLDDGTEQPSSSIKLEFIDVDNDSEPGYDAIAYTIVGDDRDWVFITGSQLEERISRIKRFALNQIGGRRNRVLPLLMLAVVGIAFVAVMLFVLPAYTTSLTQTQLQAIDSLEARWKNGEFTDSMEVIFELHRLRLQEQEPRSLWGILLVTTAGPFGVAVLIIAVLYAWAHFFPVYNFIWGDYVRVYERRKAVGRFILVGIILAIVVSVVANYLTVLLGVGQ